jgi:hypothetical protein
MNQEQIMGIIRHVLTFVGGIVVMKGYADEAFVVEVTGGILTLFGGVWSIVNKIKSGVIE